MRPTRWGSRPLECVNKQQLRRDHRQPLEVDRLDTRVPQIAHLEHARVKEPRDMAQAPLERCEERRVVERPL